MIVMCVAELCNEIVDAILKKRNIEHWPGHRAGGRGWDWWDVAGGLTVVVMLALANIVRVSIISIFIILMGSEMFGDLPERSGFLRRLRGWIRRGKGGSRSIRLRITNEFIEHAQHSPPESGSPAAIREWA